MIGRSRRGKMKKEFCTYGLAVCVCASPCMMVFVIRSSDGLMRDDDGCVCERGPKEFACVVVEIFVFLFCLHRFVRVFNANFKLQTSLVLTFSHLVTVGNYDKS